MLVAPPNLEWGHVRVQGLVNLMDCPQNNGGFHTVPKFHKKFFEWSKQNSYQQEGFKQRNFVDVPIDDPMRDEVVRIPMKAGSVLVWNSQQPHGMKFCLQITDNSEGNYPNESENFRMVQYIKMTVAEEDGQFHPVFYLPQWKPEDWLPKDFQVTDLGKKLFGMEPWK